MAQTEMVWLMHTEDLRRVLQRAQAGEQIDMIMFEELANATEQGGPDAEDR